jgi:beta-N-acetylhexosaminidase
MAPAAFITGISGLTLTPEERGFLREGDPWGLILFKRNVSDPTQVAALTESFRNLLGRDAPIFVDQEGGRVQRLGPPHWPAYPPGLSYGRLYDQDPEKGGSAARLAARLIASDLRQIGIDADCLPLADVPVDEADPVIGDRAYGHTPDKVAQLAAEIGAGLLEGGVLPVVKHIPGHGRANADSHAKLPVVDTDRATLERTDFAAFRPLTHLPMAMTAHVVFTAIDPLAPATTSATIISQVIRGFIGFDGLLMSDDVSMGALSGSIDERTRAALAAGCDIVLHCNGRLDEMQQVAAAAGRLSGNAARRAEAALAMRTPPAEVDIPAARKRFAALMRGVQPSDLGMVS